MKKIIIVLLTVLMFIVIFNSFIKNNEIEIEENDFVEMKNVEIKNNDYVVLFTDGTSEKDDKNSIVVIFDNRKNIKTITQLDNTFDQIVYKDDSVTFMHREKSKTKICYNFNGSQLLASQKACKIQQFRQGCVGERCETHRLLGDSGERESCQKGCELQCFREEKS